MILATNSTVATFSHPSMQSSRAGSASYEAHLDRVKAALLDARSEAELMNELMMAYFIDMALSEVKLRQDETKARTARNILAKYLRVF
jgi:hypothetical protein